MARAGRPCRGRPLAGQASDQRRRRGSRTNDRRTICCSRVFGSPRSNRRRDLSIVDAVVRLLDRLLQTAEADERMSDQIAILALLALSHAAGCDPNQAQAPLAAALELAEPEGYIRTFVDEGAPMRSLLIAQRAHLPAANRASDSWHTSIGCWMPSRRMYRLYSPHPQALNCSASGSAPSFSCSPLGDRSRRSPRLLVISAHTARTHVKHIYAKLDAHNRVQALERARTLQLL